MLTYFHSVKLDKDKCTGCTTCLHRCPTEAIRIRDGKARIMKERCIDCGECIRVCPHHAKIAVTDTLEKLENYKYRIALPAPSLYGQFKGVNDVDTILGAIKTLGFDAVYETSVGADVLSVHIRKMVKTEPERRPLISSACPAIVRLVQVRFPALRNNIVNMRPPMEIAAMMARKEFCRQHGCMPEEVGIFFISPCPAKMTSVKAPIGNAKSHIDGVLSMIDIYGQLSNVLQHPKADFAPIKHRGMAGGIGWAASAGEAHQVGLSRYLAVDGIHNVIKVLEEFENGTLNDVDFFEGLACTGGCVGGPLVFENNYVSRMRMRRLCQNLERNDHLMDRDMQMPDDDDDLYFEHELAPNPSLKLDPDLRVAIKMMDEIDILNAELPGLDCGSCGSPTCRCFAEDIVRGYAQEIDCIFKLREQYRSLVEQKSAENIENENHNKNK